MGTSSITRRSVLKALGFAAAGAGVSSVAVAEAVKPVFVKVGSPSFSVSPEVMAAVSDWNRTQDAKALAWQAYEATWLTVRDEDGKLVARTPRDVKLDDENSTRAAWKLACEEADEAQHTLLRQLRKTDLDLKAIYRRDAGR
ncbi:MAG TPA: hypothetical protein VGV07_21910 [Devosia sp.]|jgi:hypothetical protein|uniref:hypothetical protein n=1 Tax=Devosia sp. TaxID=1871048 RepID=UPI002DDCB5D3|nr:hypothetical protein [Devosia sp.]HEV2517923.1 hypothetical protein [Devosia sp.]